MSLPFKEAQDSSPTRCRRSPAALDLARFAIGRETASPAEVALAITGLTEDREGVIAAIADATLRLWQDTPGEALHEDHWWVRWADARSIASTTDCRSPA